MAATIRRDANPAARSALAQPDPALVAIGQRLRAARARARIPPDAEWAPPRQRASGRRGIARDDLVAYVEYRFGLPLDGSTVARWEAAHHRPRPAHLRAVVAALRDLDAFDRPDEAEVILQLAQVDEASHRPGGLDLAQLTTVTGTPSATPTMGILLALAGDTIHATYALIEDTTVLGRGRDAHVPVEALDVGRRHAAIDRRTDGTWVLRDLGSRGGTWLNGALLLRPTRLLPGDQVRLGSNTMFRFELRAWPAPGSAAPPHGATGGA